MRVISPRIFRVSETKILPKLPQHWRPRSKRRAGGSIYEHRAGTGPAQHLATGLRQSFTELVKDQPSAAFDRDAAIVLRRIEQTARDHAKVPGGGDTAYRDLLGRMLKGGLGDQPDMGKPAGESNLIIP